eukprot:jgi/Bigna1/87719/estExt_fgenesh1_pg.C_230132
MQKQAIWIDILRYALPVSTKRKPEAGSSDTIASDTAGAKTVPLIPRRFEGMMGAGVSTAGNQYFTISVRFPSAASAHSAMEFIVDTACSYTLIADKAARLLGATSTGVGATGTTATGSTSGGQFQVKAGEALCGDVSLGSLMPVSMPQLPFDYDVHGVAGILGLETLSKFDIEFDFRQQRMRLFPPGSLSSNPGLTKGFEAMEMKLIPMFGLYYIDVKLGSTLIKGIVDTGASGSVFNSIAASQAGITGTGKGVVSGAGAGQIPMKEADMQIGVLQRVVAVEKAGIADLPIFLNLFPASREAVGVLGIDFLSNVNAQGRCFFSLATRKLWL